MFNSYNIIATSFIIDEHKTKNKIINKYPFTRLKYLETTTPINTPHEGIIKKLKKILRNISSVQLVDQQLYFTVIANPNNRVTSI